MRFIKLYPEGGVWHDNIVSEENFNLITTKNPYFTNKEINVYNEAYKPINNKCFTSPYIYLEISNFQGDIKKYNYQYFLMKQGGQNPTFKFTILTLIPLSSPGNANLTLGPLRANNCSVLGLG